MKSILLVEDDPEAMTYLSMLLQQRGHRVVEASNGHAALAEIHAKCPDVVVSDLMLPGMSGHDLLKEIRSLSPKCEVKFIAITGHPTVSRVVWAVTDGADEVLLKPIDEAKLFAAVESDVATEEST